MSVPCAKDALLIVDDEAMIVRLFRSVLSSAMPQAKIETAANGLEAVEKFEKGHHHTLMMDLHMPVMDGRRAFARIKELCAEKDWDMPAVVFCTGYAPPDWVRSAMQEDSRHRMLAKPVSASVLVETVRSRMEIAS
jgi:CheY-like chemotaxis protein